MAARTPTITSQEAVLGCVPIRTTTSSGIPETLGPKLGLQHSCHYMSAIVNADHFYFRQPVVSAAFAPESNTTVEVYWDPDDATGEVIFLASALSTGWLHLWSYPGITYTAAAVTDNVTVGTPGAALVGDPLRGVPIRTTATSGLPENISGTKEELIHRVFYFSAWNSGDYFDLGRAVRSAVFTPSIDATQQALWDPDLATGRIFVNTDGASAGWLHVWSRM